MVAGIWLQWTDRLLLLDCSLLWRRLLALGRFQLLPKLLVGLNVALIYKRRCLDVVRCHQKCNQSCILYGSNGQFVLYSGSSINYLSCSYIAVPLEQEDNRLDITSRPESLQYISMEDIRLVLQLKGIGERCLVWCFKHSSVYGFIHGNTSRFRKPCYRFSANRTLPFVFSPVETQTLEDSWPSTAQ